MNEKLAIEMLQMLQMSTDTELAHVEADIVLCDLLISLGYENVVSEYDKINKWYA